MNILDIVFHPAHVVHCKLFGHMWHPWSPFGLPRYALCLRCGKKYKDERS